MTTKERRAMQAVLAREALGKLEAIGELFGAEENNISDRDTQDLELWTNLVKAFKSSIFAAPLF